MKLTLKAAFAAGAVVLASQAMASITFYEGENFRGRAVTADGAVPNLRRLDFNNRAGSVVVDRGRWEVCERPRFEGRCALLRRGNYDSLRATGLEWDISSVRPAGNRRYDQEPQASAAPVYEYRQRPNERTFQVPVNWSRAVVGQANQRCWVERQAVPVQQNASPGSAILGAVVGGILGHQVGGGSGRDAATAVGAVTGAVVGNNLGNNGGVAMGSQDVQRCATTPASATPAYYEVSYNFRGAEHRVQMSTPPGSTLIVNERGEPRM